MKQFKDSQGRPWSVSVTVASLQRIKSMAGVDLTDLTTGEPPMGVRLTTEPLLVGEVLYAIVAASAETKNVTQDDFAEALDGTALAAAFDCLTEELVDFFQNAHRSEQSSALTAQLKVLKAAMGLFTKRTESLDIEKMVESAFSKSAIASPALSESTPAA